MRGPLTPTQFKSRVDAIYDTARELVIKYGRAIEMLILIDGKNREHLVQNNSSLPFSHQPDHVRDLIRQWHATAAISVCEAWMAWHTQGRAPEVDAMAPSERPDREDVLLITGCWPLMKVTYTRCATILRAVGGVPDLAELDVASALTALGFPPDLALNSSSWLSELLPNH